MLLSMLDFTFARGIARYRAKQDAAIVSWPFGDGVFSQTTAHKDVLVLLPPICNVGRLWFGCMPPPGPVASSGRAPAVRAAPPHQSMRCLSFVRPHLSSVRSAHFVLTAIFPRLSVLVLVSSATATLLSL